MKRCLVIGLLVTSLSTFASEPMYTVNNDVTIKRYFDLVNDSYSYALYDNTDKNWTGLFLNKSSKVIDALTPMGLISVSGWYNKGDNWQVLLCKYKTPTPTATRCFVTTTYTNPTNITIVHKFVVKSDLPDAPVEVKVVYKDRELVVYMPVTNNTPIFHSDFDVFFDNTLNSN